MTENKNASEETVEDSSARPATEADTADAAVDDDTAAEDTAAEDTAEPTGKPASADEPEPTEPDDAAVAETQPKRRRDWSRVVAFALLPALALLLAIGAGVLKFMDSGVRYSDEAREQSMQAAKDSTVALLSYKPDTVEQQLTSARDRLTGEFRNQYTDLTTNVVIPGARQKQISAVASVPAAASVSADPGRAVVLLFVNQTVTVGNGAPTDTASSVRVTMEKIGDRWLISEFEPV